MAETKLELLGAIFGLQRAVLLAYAGAHKLTRHPDLLENVVQVLPTSDGREMRPAMDIFMQELKADSDAKMRRGLERMLIRSLVRDTYEAIGHYVLVSTPRQDAIMRKERWYRFARVTRNCASHEDFRLRRWDYPKDWGDEVSWLQHRVHKRMLGTELVFRLGDAFDLFNAMADFVEQRVA